MARILVVDDENNIRTMVRLALQHVGHTVDLAADGNEALDKYGEGAGYDLVLLDQRMPGLEGIEILKQMRYHNRMANIIMMTAFGTIDLAVEAMKAGAMDFMRKPFDADTLRETVNSVLRGDKLSALGTSEPLGLTFGSTTINGFRIEFLAGSGKNIENAFQQTFKVRSPDGETDSCVVNLPTYIMELVRAHIDRDEVPGGDRFWQALCEEALANHLWQSAAIPPGGRLSVDELSAGLCRFVDAILAA